MTLVELTVCIAIGVIALAVAAKLWLFTTYSFVALKNYTDLDQYSRNALDVMSRDVRQAKDLDYYSTNILVFTRLDSSIFAYVYSPTAKTLTRYGGGNRTVLLKDCDFLSFAISQRTPSNDFSFYEVTSPGTAKLIDVVWKCSRPIYGQKVNTETMQSAKIVMRN